MQGKLLQKSVLGLLMGLIFITSFAVSAAHSNNPREQPTKEIARRDFGAWTYLAREQGEAITITVELTEKNNHGLKSYMLANNELARALFGQQATVESRIVFKRPLREEQLPQTVQAARSQVKQYELRIRGAKNEKFTVFGTPDPEVFLPEERVELFINTFKQKTGAADFKGFTNVTMPLTAEHYQSLMNSPEVLFVDIAPMAAIQDLKQFSSIPIEADTTISVIYAPTFWYHEEIIDP
jgi:hypothetical protein